MLYCKHSYLPPIDSFGVESIAHITFLEDPWLNQDYFVFFLTFCPMPQVTEQSLFLFSDKKGKNWQISWNPPGAPEPAAWNPPAWTGRRERTGTAAEDRRKKNRSKTLQLRSFLNWRIMLYNEKNIYFDFQYMERDERPSRNKVFMREDARIYLMGSKFNKTFIGKDDCLQHKEIFLHFFAKYHTFALRKSSCEEFSPFLRPRVMRTNGWRN